MRKDHKRGGIVLGGIRGRPLGVNLGRDSRSNRASSGSSYCPTSILLVKWIGSPPWGVMGTSGAWILRG